jgi:hypothetical protein
MTISSRFRLHAMLVALAGLLLAGSIAAAPGKPFKVTSTLDGKTVLPQRIHWLGFPKLPSTRVREVAFLVDGKVRWIEHGAPYSYSDDGGYLVTSWLKPGLHSFTVRATSTSGKKAVDTVTARVVSPPTLPSTLAGSWRRDIAEPVPPDPSYPGDAAPAGSWTLVFDQRWIESHFPGTFDPATSPKTGAGNVLLGDYTAGSSSFTLYGAVTTGPFNLHVAAGGGWWCGPGGPKATYSWSVSSDTLTLTPVGGRDACSQRGGVFAGDWTRTG